MLNIFLIPMQKLTINPNHPESIKIHPPVLEDFGRFRISIVFNCLVMLVDGLQLHVLYMLDFDGFYAATYYTNFHVSMVIWYPESAKIHQKVSGGFWRIQDTCMSNIYIVHWRILMDSGHQHFVCDKIGGFWWIQDTFQ